LLLANATTPRVKARLLGEVEKFDLLERRLRPVAKVGYRGNSGPQSSIACRRRAANV
jgi:hypothetical protein